VAGVIVITAFGQVLRNLERGVLGPFTLGAHPGLQELGLAALMLIILIFRPRGLTGGREIALLPRSWWKAGPKPGEVSENRR
jgi:branched-chain amino acid transport system permease protein